MSTLWLWICFTIACCAFATSFPDSTNDLVNGSDSPSFKNNQLIIYKPLSEFYKLPPDPHMFVLAYNLWIPNSTTLDHVRIKRFDWSRAGWVAAGAACGAFVGGGIGALVAGPVGFGVGAAKGFAEGAAIGSAGGIAAAVAGLNGRRKRSLFIECELMRGLFKVTDVNKDGRLSFDELKANSTETLNALKALDTNNSSYLEPYEFNKCLTFDYSIKYHFTLLRSKRQYFVQPHYMQNGNCGSCYGCSQISALYTPQYSTIYI
ncbi:hypothetical protein Mgra_00000566 [Meloidogyne graminicola]|uniref:EF-hand domain-containing protein n=1 Tax=Meloidogyne graminicola TaxID=189291 RepID=A0A8T0A477_9BILA|nr:hypothetical protein Mgra_00000566 [Meloidogyne graminicola]